MASPLEYLKLGKTGLTDEQLTAAAAVMAAPWVWPWRRWPRPPPASPRSSRPSTPGPGSERRARVLTGVAVGALAAMLAGAYTVRATEVATARDQAAQADARAAEIDQQVQKLVPFETAANQITAMRTAAESALTNDVDLPVFMDRITGAMPTDVGLTSFTFTLAAPGVAAPAAPGSEAPIGTITVSGEGLSHDSTAHWITQLRQLGILSDLWVPSSSKGGDRVTFSSNANITSMAKSNRADLFKAGEL